MKKIIFFGTPEFAATHLQAIFSLTDRIKVVGVFTQPDRPAGRGKKVIQSPVKKIAMDADLPVFQPTIVDHPDAQKTITQLKPDLGITVAFGHILSAELLKIPALGMINVHASLLPRLRGSSPIQYAILNGLSTTGISIIQMDTGVDTGPIFAQASLSIHPDETAETLHDRLADLGAKTLAKQLPLILSGSIKAKPQKGEVSTCRRITKQQGKIDWTADAIEIDRKVRAMTPWPGTFTQWNEKKKTIRILKSSLESVGVKMRKPKIGQVFQDGEDLVFVQCGKDSLRILELQLEGKNAMPIQDFIIGHPDFIGTVLE